MTMTTRLVQRLRARPAGREGVLTRAFGGGMMAMSSDQWDMLQSVFDLDLMGAAEYEFGALPKSLATMVAHRKEYAAWSFCFPANKIKPGWWRENVVVRLRRKQLDEAKSNGTKAPRYSAKKLEALAGITPVKDRTIWVIGRRDRVSDIEDLIIRVGRQELEIKNGSGMADELDIGPGARSRIRGWYDLTNETFWFIDEEMWKNTASLFEVEPIGGANTSAGSAEAP